MARGRKAKPEGVIEAPDYELAARIFRSDITPANSEQRAAMQTAGEGYKTIKKEAHVHPWAVRTCSSLLKNDDAERDIKLRDLKGMMIALGITLSADLVDLSEGAEPGDEIDIIPTGAAPKIEMPVLQ